MDWLTVGGAVHLVLGLHGKGSTCDGTTMSSTSRAQEEVCRHGTFPSHVRGACERLNSSLLLISIVNNTQLEAKENALQMAKNEVLNSICLQPEPGHTT